MYLKDTEEFYQEDNRETAANKFRFSPTEPVSEGGALLSAP